MNTVKLDKKQIESFAWLDPFEIRAFLENPSTFALGGVTGDGEESEPVALMICTADGRELTIDWLAVAPEHRFGGFGEQMLLSAYKMVDSMDIPEISAVISAEMAREGVAREAVEFFSDRLFDGEHEIISNIVMSLEDIGENEYLQEDPKKLPQPVSLSSLSMEQRNRVLQGLSELEGLECLYELHAGNRRLCMDTSMVFLDDEEPYGAFLVQKGESSLLPVAFYAESDREAAGLIVSSYLKAVDTYGKDMDILIKTAGPSSEKVAELIIKNVAAGKKLTAKLADYRAVAEENEQ